MFCAGRAVKQFRALALHQEVFQVVLYLQEACQEDGQVLNKLLLIIRALLVCFRDVSSNGQHCDQLVHEDDIQLYKMCLCFLLHRQAANLQVQLPAGYCAATTSGITDMSSGWLGCRKSPWCFLRKLHRMTKLTGGLMTSWASSM